MYCRQGINIPEIWDVLLFFSLLEHNRLSANLDFDKKLVGPWSKILRIILHTCYRGTTKYMQASYAFPFYSLKYCWKDIIWRVLPNHLWIFIFCCPFEFMLQTLVEQLKLWIQISSDQEQVTPSDLSFSRKWPVLLQFLCFYWCLKNVCYCYWCGMFYGTRSRCSLFHPMVGLLTPH